MTTTTTMMMGRGTMRGGQASSMFPPPFVTHLHPLPPQTTTHDNKDAGWYVPPSLFFVTHPHHHR